jgi:hypothetical protein
MLQHRNPLLRLPFNFTPRHNQEGVAMYTRLDPFGTAAA